MKKIAYFIVATALMAACGNTETPAEDAQPITPDELVIEEDEIDPDRWFVPADANVYFKNIADGDVVSSPVKIEMGCEGMEVIAAGPIKKGTGHHHILINKGFMEVGEVIPMDATHLHYGKGQTEATLELEPGTYQLTMQFANGVHESFGEQMSSSISITVE